LRPFWERYPLQYLKTKDGAQVFSADCNVSEEHDAHLKGMYFPIVAQMRRFPRYTNKRIVDPQLKCYLDEKKIDILPGWGLPKPNQGAAYKSLAKYGKDILPMSPQDVQDMNTAWDWVERQFGPCMQNSKVISLEEAITHLDMATSTGGPFNIHYPVKKEMFEKDPLMIEWLAGDWEVLASDSEWTCICTNSLKEEMRTQEKLDENSIRTFTAMANDCTVHGTRLFVDMNERMYASHLSTASAVGLSPLKGNWNRLYHKLKRFNKGYALDESQYDSSLRVFLMWGCAQFRWRMLRKEDQTPANFNRVKTMYRNLINTLILTPEGILVFKKTGNPSGSVNTISDNTLILYCLLAYAWIKTSRNQPEMESYEAFEEETAKALVGDDNTWTVSDEAHEFYNATTVIAVWKTLGITTTTDSMEPRVPEDLDFLSARTVFLDGIAVPLYERAKLMNSLLYAPKKNITPATTLERTAAMMTIGWTDIPFRKFCRDVMEWLVKKYEPVLYDDPRWILAKCQIQTDNTYYALFTGKRVPMRPQSYLETQERLEMLDKSSMNGAIGRKGQGRKPKTNKRRRLRPRNRKGGPNGPNPSSAVRQNRVPRRRNGTSRRRQGRRLADPSAIGAGKNSTSRLTGRSCTIAEDEYIAEVIGPGTGANFNNVAYSINPGQVSTFPWLSKIAAQWEKYHFNSLEFYYKPEVTGFATAGQSGKVILSVDFDASDAPPASKQQMEDTMPHADGMPAVTTRMPLMARQLHALYPTLYVRPGGLPGASDIKTYDAGNFNIATQGLNSNGATLGELRVKYNVTLSVPVLESTTTAPANNSVVVFNSNAGEALTTAQFLQLLLVTETGSLGAVNTAGSIVLPAGNYKWDVRVQFVGASTTTISGALIKLAKNGTAINGVASPEIIPTSGTTLSQCELSDVGFVSMNGTDALTLSAFATFAVSTCTAIGYLVILAV